MDSITSAPTLCTAAVTLLTVLLFFYMTFNIGRMRGKHNVKAPAMTGHIEFECAVRVQMNTLEGMIMFLPSLWLASIYFGGYLPSIAGGVWVIGRVAYMQGYMAAPEKRSTGFLIQFLGLAVVFLLAVWGVVSGFINL